MENIVKLQKAQKAQENVVKEIGVEAGDFVIANKDITRKEEIIASRGEVYEIQKVNEAGFVLIIGDSGKARWVNMSWGLSKMDNFEEMFA